MYSRYLPNIKLFVVPSQLSLTNEPSEWTRIVASISAQFTFTQELLACLNTGKGVIRTNAPNETDRGLASSDSRSSHYQLASVVCVRDLVTSIVF